MLVATLFQRKQRVKNMLLDTFFSITGFFFIPFLRTLPAFCTISPFYFGYRLVIFQAQLHAFNPPNPTFQHKFCPSGHVFNGTKGAYLFLYSVYLCLSFCINPHFWLTFSTKTHCIQHQNALHLAPKRTPFYCKQPVIWCKWLSFHIKIHFATFTG